MTSRTKSSNGNKTPIGISSTDMGRPPKSKALKAVQGTMRSGRDLTPKLSTVDRSMFPDPIITLSDRGRRFYDLTIDHLNEAQALHNVDAMLLSILAKNVDIMIEAADQIADLDDVVQEFDSGATNITGTFTAFERATKNIITLSSKLGLSPSDREKLMSFAQGRTEGADEYEILKRAAMG